MLAFQHAPSALSLGEPFTSASSCSASTSVLPILAPSPVRRKPKHPALPRPTSSEAPSRPPSRTERRFACAFEGCDKAYFKPARLREHELSHTGERPHACPHCDQTYLRASHLTAHLRIHLSKDAKPFVCTRDGCDKTFWTATHLRRHEQMHDKAAAYPCEHCAETFPKTHLLRDHIVLAHMPAGTKPYTCLHQGCSWSFALKHQLKAHEKTHEATRYTCSHASHDDNLPSFPTWSALQTHLHSDHPPTCPHPECDGRMFKTAQRLKEHLKVHPESSIGGDEPSKPEIRSLSREGVKVEDEVEADLKNQEIKAAPSSSRKRRRQSEAGSATEKTSKLSRPNEDGADTSWVCEEEGCEKRFKTKFARNNHRRSFHDNDKPHRCPQVGCDKAYAHLQSLQKHLDAHSRPTSPILAMRKRVPEAVRLIGAESGEGEFKRYGCPSGSVPRAELCAVKRESREASSRDIEIEEDEEPCHARFWRVYDVRRHLRADHDLDLEDAEVRGLLGLALV